MNWEKERERKRFFKILGRDQDFEISQQEQDENQTPDIKA